MLEQLYTMVVVAQPTINTQGIIGWFLRVIVPLIALFIVAGILMGAKRGQYREEANKIVIFIIGIAFLVGIGAIVAFSQGIAGWIVS